MLQVPEIRNIESLLVQGIGPSCKYLRHTSKYLTAPGENYGSTMLAVDVIYRSGTAEKPLALVAKLCPPSDILKDAFLTSITFKKESDAYTNACSRIEKFQFEFKIPEWKFLDVFPKCYGARLNLACSPETVDDDAVILLENLKTQGYTVEDRFTGFDFQTSKLIINNLARLHASVIAIRLLKPDEFTRDILPSLTTINNGAVMIDGFVDAAVNLARTIEDCQPFWEKFKAAMDDRKVIRGLRFPVETNKDFSTMIHTDFWTNNIMVLKNNNNQTTKIKIVDLQLTDYGSPIRDLLFFIYSSVQIPVFDQHFDDLIALYHKSFLDCLNDFGCDVSRYSWKLFLEELNAVAPHELFHIAFMLKPIFSERGSIESLDSIDVKDFERTDNLGEMYAKKLKQVLVSFAKKNWL